MARDRDNLLRGQGLLRQGITSASSRWKTYARLIAATTMLGAIGLPIYDAEPGQIFEYFEHQFARLECWVAQGTQSEPTILFWHDGGWYRPFASEIATNPYFIHRADTLEFAALIGGIIGALLGLGACYGLARLMRERGKAVAQDKVISGSVTVDEKTLAKRTRRLSDSRSLYIATVPIPSKFECRHFSVSGSTGSGKTTLLRQMLDGIEARGEPALVYDTSGDFIRYYYNPARGDVILNPFDARSAYWSPFDEIKHPADADRIAHQLVVATGKDDQDVWLETARILVANILRVMRDKGKTSLIDLHDTLQKKTKAELKTLLAGTSSARTFEDDADRATASVIFMLSRVSNLIQFLMAEPGEAGSFAFHDFIHGLDTHHGAKPWIFVPRKEKFFEAVKPLMACWLECAASATLDLPPLKSRRLWFILDELADLPRVDNLARLLPEGRKFGAATVLTFQCIGQMHNRYGRNSAEAMLGCCNTKLFLQSVDPDTREWASKSIGKVEVEIRSASDMLENTQGGGRTSLGTVRHVRAAVLESQIRLEQFHGYLQFPDALPVGKVILTQHHILARGGERHPAFIAADENVSLWKKTEPSEPESAPVDNPKPDAPEPSTALSENTLSGGDSPVAAKSASSKSDDPPLDSPPPDSAGPV